MGKPKGEQTEQVLEQPATEVSDYSQKVTDLKAQLKNEPKWFIGKMVCSKCNNLVLVRYDVYLARLIKAESIGQTEEEMNGTYVCKKCRSGSSVKKSQFDEMIKKQREKQSKAE